MGSGSILLTFCRCCCCLLSCQSVLQLSLVSHCCSAKRNECIFPTSVTFQIFFLNIFSFSFFLTHGTGDIRLSTFIQSLGRHGRPGAGNCFPGETLSSSFLWVRGVQGFRQPSAELVFKPLRDLKVTPTNQSEGERVRIMG